MTRTLKEWHGKTPDSAVPPRVRLRVLKRYGSHCADCTRIIATGERWTCDHVVALVNGGMNRERNLQPLCCWCEPIKSGNDVRIKARTYRKERKHAGIKIPAGRPIVGTLRSGVYKPMVGPPRWRDSGRVVGGR